MSCALRPGRSHKGGVPAPTSEQVWILRHVPVPARPHPAPCLRNYVYIFCTQFQNFWVQVPGTGQGHGQPEALWTAGLGQAVRVFPAVPVFWTEKQKWVHPNGRFVADAQRSVRPAPTHGKC